MEVGTIWLENSKAVPVLKKVEVGMEWYQETTRPDSLTSIANSIKCNMGLAKIGHPKLTQ